MVTVPEASETVAAKWKSSWKRKEEYGMEERDRLERMMEQLIETEGNGKIRPGTK